MSQAEMTEAFAEQVRREAELDGHLLVPLPLAQRILDILVQLPYGQVADVANALRDLEPTDPTEKLGTDG